MNDETILESIGVWEFKRIDRPVVVYDQRSKYNFDKDDFERSMNDRRHIASDLIEQDIQINFSKEDDYE